jgi:hypothetical protein
VGAVVRDLFTAGKLVSVAAACTSLFALERLLRRRLSPGAGALGALLLVCNPVFLRYSYSATTDATACGLGLLSVALLLTGGGRGPWIAGSVAALAAFTRYNFAALFPASIASLLWLERPAGVTRKRAVIAYVLGFALLAAPWTAFSLAHGALPGAGLFRNAAFYANPEATRNVQDRPVASPEVAAPGESTAAAPAAGGGSALARAAGNFGTHLRLDLTGLAGWPVAVLAAAGLVVVALDAGVRGALLPLLLHGAALFVALLPIFYSDRYSLAHLPALLALACAAAVSPRLSPRLGRTAVPLGLIAAMACAAWSGRQAWTQTRLLHTQLPVETRAAGQVLAQISSADARVIARKAHVGFYGGRRTVPFPRLGTLAELAGYARDQRADFLYFSWYEGELRPEFWFLLDTTGVVPGLTPEFATTANPAVLYRIGAHFGEIPEWFANDTLRVVHDSRAQAMALPDALAWRAHLVLGVDAIRHGRRDEAIRELEIVVRVRPDQVAAARLLESLRAGSGGAAAPPGAHP